MSPTTALWRYIGNGEKNMVDKKKKDYDGRKLSRAFKTASLPDAIVDGKFIGKVGTEIVVNRFRNGKESFHICTIKQIEESGLLHTWDETIQQWFVFPINEAPKLVKLYK